MIQFHKKFYNKEYRKHYHLLLTLILLLHQWKQTNELRVKWPKATWSVISKQVTHKLLHFTFALQLFTYRWSIFVWPECFLYRALLLIVKVGLYQNGVARSQRVPKAKTPCVKSSLHSHTRLSLEPKSLGIQKTLESFNHSMKLTSHQ